jgi:hypothetical protein
MCHQQRPLPSPLWWHCPIKGPLDPVLSGSCGGHAEVGSSEKKGPESRPSFASSRTVTVKRVRAAPTRTWSMSQCLKMTRHHPKDSLKQTNFFLHTPLAPKDSYHHYALFVVCLKRDLDRAAFSFFQLYTTATFPPARWTRAQFTAKTTGAQKKLKGSTPPSRVGWKARHRRQLEVQDCLNEDKRQRKLVPSGRGRVVDILIVFPFVCLHVRSFPPGIIFHGLVQWKKFFSSSCRIGEFLFRKVR